MQKQALLIVLLFGTVLNLWSAPVVMTVPATSNIFRAGTSDTTAYTSQSGQGTYPVQYPGALPSGPDPFLVLYFPNMTGTVSYNSAYASQYSAGPDGLNTGPSGTNTLVGTTINSANGIAGISKSNTIMFLVGVFLGAGAPNNNTGPAANNYNDGNTRPEFHPVIGQTFFIGDGRTAGGATQRFYVPNGASRLYLGFADGNTFSGAPGWYGDNGGSFSVTTNFVGSVPEPGTIGLVSMALLGLGLRLRKRT
jgi:PEP-CTERM motif-containing protein